MRFDDYIAATNAAETPEALFGLLEQVAGQEGFSQLVYTCLTNPMPVEPKAELKPPSIGVVFLQYPEQWVGHYLQNDCHLIDPVVEMAPTLIRPFTWEWLLRQPQVTRAGKVFMMDAEEAGLRDGVSVPMTGPGGSAFVLSFARDSYGEPAKASLRYLHSISLQLHFAYCSMAKFREPRPGAVLSQRAVQCLTLSAGGLTAEEISDRLKIPEKMVRHHFKAAADTLGTRTLVHTVYEAIRANLIPLEAAGKRRIKN